MGSIINDFIKNRNIILFKSFMIAFIFLLIIKVLVYTNSQNFEYRTIKKNQLMKNLLLGVVGRTCITNNSP